MNFALAEDLKRELKGNQFIQSQVLEYEEGDIHVQVFQRRYKDTSPLSNFRNPNNKRVKFRYIWRYGRFNCGSVKKTQPFN
jgi:hypothetical protein